MREAALLCQLMRHFVVTTASAHGGRTAPNLLAGLGGARRDQGGVADIPAIRLPTFVSLASVLEAYARRCIGWQRARPIDARLPLSARAQALTARQPARG